MSEIRGDRFDDDAESSESYLPEARNAVRLPATLLMLTGVLGIIGAVLGMIQLNSIPGKIDEFIAAIEKDQTKTKEEQDQAIDGLTVAKELVEGPAAILFYVFQLGCSFLVLFGGIRMIQLSGPAIPSIASVIAMIPCTVGCCCLIGLPAGIISLIALNRPAVRSVMSGVRRDEE